MQELDDNALLREYAQRHSEEAFAALVTRHVNQVYSVALRHTGQPHAAEEITQAVFVILAGKSRSLSPRVILSGWLYQTARLTALTFIRGEIRRARREQEAHMQTMLEQNEDAAWTQIAPLLDTAMAGLSEADRHAVVLRFFDGKSLREVGAALGANEDAARMRVDRALEKLRRFFVKRGVRSTTAIIAGAISANSVQAAPPALAQTATALALGKGMAASATTLPLAKATLLIMKTKTLVLSLAAVAVILGTGAYLATRAETHSAAAPTGPAGIVRVGNDAFNPDGDQDGRFLVEVDPATRRTANSPPAIHIAGPIGSAAGPLTIAPGANQATDNSSSFQYHVTAGSPFLGKRIRVTGWLKTKNARSWGSAFLIISQEYTGYDFSWDDMSDRPLRGTADWQPVELVSDLPNEPCIIYFGPDLYGSGELWGDDFQISLAAPDEAVTDDRTWRFHAPERQLPCYSESTDYANMHNGNAPVCLACTNGVVPRGAWMWWCQDTYAPEKYRGHTIRMTGWVKTENVTGRFQPRIRPCAGDKKQLGQDRLAGGSLKGTRDWTEFSVTCAIPKSTFFVETGFYFGGGGKAWIDRDSLKIEIIN